MAERYYIKQGDAYAIPISITVNNERITASNLDMIDKVEFMVGDTVRKVYPDDVAFDNANSIFAVPVTQEETFSMEDGDTISIDVRVAFANSDDVIGTRTMKKAKIVDALSEAVI